MRIPLYNRRGDVSAFAEVDDIDYLLVGGYRWSLVKGGYAVRSDYEGERKVSVYMHRQILGLQPGDKLEVDHINRDKLDNRRDNLRTVDSRAEQLQNVPARGGSSRYRGVGWDKTRQKWIAKVQLNGQTHNLGRFDEEAEAARRCQAFRECHMPYAEPDPALAA